MKKFSLLTCLLFSLLAFIIACKPASEKPQTETPTPTQTTNTATVDNTQLQSFGKKYATAWCSQHPEKVAAFFAEDGSLKVNDATPAVGREAITKVAQGFMTAFPDLVVSMDSLVPKANGAAFYWTLMGGNTGPNGTGKRVRINGVELWQLNSEGLISQSIGTFDANEYNRQLKVGVNH